MLKFSFPLLHTYISHIFISNDNAMKYTLLTLPVLLLAILFTQDHHTMVWSIAAASTLPTLITVLCVVFGDFSHEAAFDEGKEF